VTQAETANGHAPRDSVTNWLIDEFVANAAASSNEAQARCRVAVSIDVIFGLRESTRLAGLTIARNARHSLSGRGGAQRRAAAVCTPVSGRAAGS
jgi:hypothetical protein